MGWPKGKKRGISPMKGYRRGKILAVDPRQLAAILADDQISPEKRFAAAMEALLPAMEGSSNVTVHDVGAFMRLFWDHDMEKTLIYTPGWKP